MLHVNSVQLLGVVGDASDIKVHRLPGGESCAEFTLVTDKYCLNAKTGRQEVVAQYHRVVVWPHYLVDMVEHHIRPGVAVMVMGELEYEGDEVRDGGSVCSPASVVLQGAAAQLLLLDEEVAVRGKE